jgi:hypothetical protein
MVDAEALNDPDLSEAAAQAVRCTVCKSEQE